MSVRIAITGGGGFVGRQLVPRLIARGASVLLIGRDVDALRDRCAGCDVTSYEDMSASIAGYDLLLHLAVVNNDQVATWDEILRANVELPVTTSQRASAAGVRIFAFASSSLALSDSDQTPYARSKRMAEDRLREVQGIATTILYFPAVHGDELAGKLAQLDRLPESLRAIALKLPGALKPIVHVDRIVEALLALVSRSQDDVPPSMIVSDGQRDNAFFRFGKRVFEVGFAVAVIVVLWWAMLVIWLLVRIQSDGPGIFRQVRVGKGEREFTCYKFRTMLTSTPSVGTHDAPASSVTPLGRFLRRTKLDELPQVYNILANQMSLVGPRPCLPNQVELIDARRRRGVFAVTPGITGLAQVRGIDMSDPERLARCDEQYLGLQSLLLDIKIAIRTFLGGGSGDRVSYGAAQRAKPS